MTPLAEIKLGMLAAVQSSIATSSPFFFFSTLLRFFLLTQFKYHNGPLFYRVRPSNICHVRPLTARSDYRKPISLISHSDVRYRGILAGIDPAASTIQLSNGMDVMYPWKNNTDILGT